jgi:hypothetical protein
MVNIRERLIEFLKNENTKQQIQEIINPIVNIIYNEFYVYVWFICIYNVFLIFIILVNLFLLLNLIRLKS